MRLKKMAAVVVSVFMILSLAACSSGGSASSASSGASDASDGQGFSICIITSTGIDDGSFNQNCYEGIQAFLADHPDCTVTDVKEPDYNELIPTVERMVGDYDVLVLPGFNFAACGDVAAANPDTIFIVVDSTITDAEGNAMSLDNVYTMTFAEQESGFYCGIGAALTTETGLVAVVNAMAYPSNVNYQYGFMAGVNYANKIYDVGVECVELPSYAGVDVFGNNIGGNYTGDFGDEATGKVVGAALIDAGCDVLFVAAGNSGNGVFTAAKESDGVWLIGCDVDQYDDGAKGDDNIMLTSGLKLMDVQIEKQLNAIYDGTFVGEDAYLNAQNGGTGFVSAEGRQHLSDLAIEAMTEAEQLVYDGTIVPPADATVNDSTPDNFVGL